MKIITSPSCILLVSDVRLHEESKRSYFLALTLASARGWMFIHMNTRLCIINSEIWTELGCASSFVWLLKVEAKGLRSTAWESSLHLIPQLLRIHPYTLCWCRVWSGRRTFMWLFDSNSPKSSNRKQIPDRYCSLFPNSVNHQLATAQSPTTHRVLDGASSSFESVGREVYCRTPQRFRKSIRPPSPPIPRRSFPPPAPRQVSYLHRAAQAQPIFQEDGDRNVTNPSVLVWICMLIWSNSPSGDRAREQFNHAIYDSCFPSLLCDTGSICTYRRVRAW